MEKTYLNFRRICLFMAALLFLTTTSCTDDTSEETLYEQQAKQKRDTKLKPRIDRMDVQSDPDNG